MTTTLWASRKTKTERETSAKLESFVVERRDVVFLRGLEGDFFDEADDDDGSARLGDGDRPTQGRVDVVF